MKMRFLTAAALLVSALLYAQPVKTQSGKNMARVLKATFHRTKNNIGDPVVNYTLLIVWKGPKRPTSFYFRPDDGWLGCQVARAHRVSMPGGKFSGMAYTTENIELQKIRTGDTLEILPFYGGKFPIPEGIENIPGKNLFFQSGGNTWSYVGVSSFIRES